MNPKNTVPMFRFEISGSEMENKFVSTFREFLQSGQMSLGNQVSQFEIEFAKYIGVDHVVGVANGTDAIELALRALGVNRGSKVATVANAGFYTTTALLAIGASVVFMDVSSSSGLVTKVEVEHTLRNEKPDVIVITHLFGHVVSDMARIVSLAQSYGVKILEDCAQAHGARLHGQIAGTFGDIAAFSHYPTKNLGALGDGGSVATQSTHLAQRVKLLRQYGWTSKYIATEPGRNSRLDEVQAAFLRLKLPNLDESNHKRVLIAQSYLTRIDERPGLLQHLSPIDPDGFVAHLFVMTVSPSHRKSLLEHLEREGVSSAIHYPIPDHLQPAMRDYDCRPLPNTERWCESTFSLPLFPGMAKPEVDKVIAVVNAWQS